MSVNVAEPSVLLHHSSGDVISAIGKQPVTVSSLDLSTLNLAGDRQADTRPTPAGGQVHGGPDQAVYAFPVEHFPRLVELVGSAIDPGFMGENVTLRGALEADVCIGDTWQWGRAVVQVTAPRGPCFKLGIRIGTAGRADDHPRRGFGRLVPAGPHAGRRPHRGQHHVDRAASGRDHGGGRASSAAGPPRRVPRSRRARRHERERPGRAGAAGARRDGRRARDRHPRRLNEIKRSCRAVGARARGAGTRRVGCGRRTCGCRSSRARRPGSRRRCVRIPWPR